MIIFLGLHLLDRLMFEPAKESLQIPRLFRMILGTLF